MRVCLISNNNPTFLYGTFIIYQLKLFLWAKTRYSWEPPIKILLKKNYAISNFKEIKPVHPKGNQLWIFTGRTDAEAPILRPPDAKSWLTGKDMILGKIEGKRRKGEQRMRWTALPTQCPWIWANWSR